MSHLLTFRTSFEPAANNTFRADADILHGRIVDGLSHREARASAQMILDTYRDEANDDEETFHGCLFIAEDVPCDRDEFDVDGIATLDGVGAYTVVLAAYRAVEIDDLSVQVELRYARWSGEAPNVDDAMDEAVKAYGKALEGWTVGDRIGFKGALAVQQVAGELVKVLPNGATVEEIPI